MCRVNKKKNKVNLNIKSVIPKPILNRHCKINIIDQNYQIRDPMKYMIMKYLVSKNLDKY